MGSLLILAWRCVNYVAPSLPTAAVGQPLFHEKLFPGTVFRSSSLSSYVFASLLAATNMPWKKCLACQNAYIFAHEHYTVDWHLYEMHQHRYEDAVTEDTHDGGTISQIPTKSLG